MREASLTGGATSAPDAPATPLEINLSKIKLDGAGLFVEYITGEADGHAEMTAKHKRPVHADLVLAFDQLVPHLALLCDLVQGVRDGDVYVSAGQLFYGLDPQGLPLHERPEFKGLKVTGLTYSSTGVVLIGQKRYRGGKVLNLITPHEVLEPKEFTGMEYDHLWELNAALARVEMEAHAYLAGKTGSPPPEAVQSELDFEAETPFGGPETASVGKGKKRGKDAAAGNDN